MNTQDAKALAYAEMKKWELLQRGWKFKWSYGFRVFGYCSSKRKEIALSMRLTKINDEAEVLDTIRHEIAHALDYIHHGKMGHGPTWRAWCLKTGANPKRTYSAEEVQQPKMKYTLRCASCGNESQRARMRKTQRFSCAKCAPGRFDERFLLGVIQNW